MTNTSDLANKDCVACAGGVDALSTEAVKEMMAQLHEDWALSADGSEISRRFKFKAFAKAVYTANLAAWLSDQTGHHSDTAFGWGYCTVTYTTHESGGLSENDFICAAKLDRAVSP